MTTNSQTVGRLLAMERAGWANLPRSGLSGRASAPAGSGSVLVERDTGAILVDANGKPVTRRQRIDFPRALRIDRGRFRQHVSVFENNVPYMYLDTTGNVTVGLGHLLPDADEVQRLPFCERGTANPAHPAHIENAFDKVLNSGLTGSPHSVFMNLTHIDLDLGAIEALFDDDVAGFVKQLKASFPEFETYPATAQLGMLDLAYNMGTQKFFGLFNKFRAALAFRNWVGVADESKRTETDGRGNPVPSVAARNRVVRGWFLEAIRDEPFFLNPDRPPARLPTPIG